MKEFLNATDLHEAAEWIQQQLEPFDTSPLRLHLKRHRRKDQLFSGYCRYDDSLIVAAIHEKMPVPFLLQKPIGSTPNKRRRCGYDYLWHELVIETEAMAMVWVVGHECWHYLCKTKQMKGNWETRANKYGFEWAERYANESAKQTYLFKWMAAPAPKKSKKLKVVYG
jgi:hypothetical protein